ncbi:hypothetical protein BDV25DRAFT_136068 [Aspergillus avenaceus]|uniref:Uncharacterized protein n=1 Tax=Aspergillus avenaceus TaxID=36643 RepID=A0A5N6U8D5_ASPAV|nr:hypothetical protein BDV25DRAFT_136068 [Aspergillus avenaceus]
MSVKFDHNIIVKFSDIAIQGKTQVPSPLETPSTYNNDTVVFGLFDGQLDIIVRLACLHAKALEDRAAACADSVQEFNAVNEWNPPNDEVPADAPFTSGEIACLYLLYKFAFLVWAACIAIHDAAGDEEKSALNHVNVQGLIAEALPLLDEELQEDLYPYLSIPLFVLGSACVDPEGQSKIKDVSSNILEGFKADIKEYAGPMFDMVNESWERHNENVEDSWDWRRY